MTNTLIVLLFVVIIAAVILLCIRGTPGLLRDHIVGGYHKKMKRTHHNKMEDSNNTTNYYYHGSTADTDGPLVPMPHNVINGESAVFASNNMSVALMFIGKWSDAEISYGHYNGIHHAIELYPGAFDKLHAGGYLYYLDSSYFTEDKRLGLQGKEFISYKPVPISRKEYIPDAFAKMKSIGDIRFIEFDQFMEKLFQ